MSGRSIRLRLTLWCAGSTLLILLAGTNAVRTVVRFALEAEFKQSLAASNGLVQGFFRVEIAEYRRIEATLAHIAGELVIPDRRIEFIRPDGTSFVVPDSSRIADPVTLAEPTRVTDSALSPSLAPRWRVRITASTASLVRQLRAVDRAALLAIPLAFALAFAVGWVLTGRTLHPVAQMADAADRITAGAGGRLPVADPDDELGRLGLRFNALLDRLDSALSRQRRFLAAAAHELRTPIACARGVGELALSTPDLAAGDRAALEQTQHELEMMSHLLDELLELARTEASGVGAPNETVYLDDLVAEAARAFGALAARRGIRIEVEVPEEVPVQGNGTALQRLVGILVDNALRYSGAAGVVHLTARRAADGAEIEVRDAGIGIPPDERARLFERLFRGVEARKAVPDGSGLGLAIAQAIAARHEATITFDASVTVGTRVVVRFG